jgi:hypothetical protein
MSAFEQVVTLVEEQPLSRSLPTALRVAIMIADEEWAAWIRLESMGYFARNPAMKDSTIVPEYRAVSGQWYDDYGRMFAVDNSQLGFINELRLREGVAELEGLASGSGPLAMRPTELSEFIKKDLNTHVTVFQFSRSSVSQILTNIKVHLLDQLANRMTKIMEVPDAQITKEAEILQIKPGFYGVSIDMKALWRRIFSKKPR